LECWNKKNCKYVRIGSGVLVIRWGDDDVLALLLPVANKWGTVSLIPVEIKTINLATLIVTDAWPVFNTGSGVS
jgi:hypothetical protein